MKHLSRLVVLAGCFTFGLPAEDFWLKKPYTDWANKEAARLLENSPWAHPVSISLAVPVQPMENAGGGRGRNRGSGGGMGDMPAAGSAEDAGMAGSRSRGRGGSEMESMTGGNSV